MRGLDIGLLVTIAILLVAGAREWQRAEDESRLLKRRIEVLEKISATEHPELVTWIDWSTYK